MHNNSQFNNEQIHAISIRHVAIAILFTLITSAIIIFLIIHNNHHKLEIYSSDTGALNKSLVIKPKNASTTTSYAPVSMSFNLPISGQ